MLRVTRIISGLILVPLVASSLVRVVVVDPIIKANISSDLHDQLSKEQQFQVSKKLHEIRENLDYDIMMGHSPPLTEKQMNQRLREEGLMLEEEQHKESEKAVGNIVSDTLFFGSLTATLLLNKGKLGILKQIFREKFFTFEPATQAFVLLLAADILVGYHSSDGWFAVLRLLQHHYAIPDSDNTEELISVFVATVPVGLDVAFKFWVFNYLRSISPSTQIILDEIDRH